MVNDNEIEDYVPKYANPAIHFATDDMGSDEAMGGVLLDILIVIIRIYFCSYDQQYDHKRVICNRNIACVRLYERGAGTPLSVYAGYRYPDFRISRKCAWLYGI